VAELRLTMPIGKEGSVDRKPNRIFSIALHRRGIHSYAHSFRYLCTICVQAVKISSETVRGFHSQVAIYNFSGVCFNVCCLISLFEKL
jgi:hypothetical protein